MMIFIAIVLFILHALETKQLISTALYNLFEGETVPAPVSIPSSTLALDHPVKRMTTKEDILDWLISHTPCNLPQAMKERFYLDYEWKVKYIPLPLAEMKMVELQAIAQIGAKPEKKNIKASLVMAIASREKKYLTDFWNWSDSLARSLKSTNQIDR
ncbi:hypothetical protein C7H19_24445 [Aphanothece hegewaldii CCALA 016]|uniref:Uncharacterized protein n=2 Tax=Aphanothece TaxID=1121 RepID=A0A2T1LQP9_9CHRO|nr:hypothetical protein C7H19_24445 [Aphanothece hegewaldii CCALA 016]